MAQQVVPATQLVLRYHTIRRCNNYVVLQGIPCSPECNIVGKILLDHPLSYALTATVDVPVEFTFTVDMFRVTLHFPVETPKNPFVAPVNIQTIEAFMNKVGYQGMVDKKFPNIPQRIDEDYHSIKDDIPLVSVYTIRNVLVRGMLILNEFLTEEIRAIDDFKESEMVFVGVDVPMNQPQPKVDEKKDAEMGSLETRTEEMQTPIPTTPRSPRTILSSDKNITQELMDTVSLPTTTTSKNPHSKQRISSKYSHLPFVLRRMCKRQGYMIQNMERKCVTTKYFWKTHKKVDRVLYEIVSQLAKRATDDLNENNLKPSIAATIIEDRDAFRSEVPDLVSKEFNAQAPKIIEELFKNYVQSNVIQVHPTTTTSTETTSSADLQQQLYLKMKISLPDQANDPVLWEVLKRKFEKSSTSNTSYRYDDIHSQRHDDHQEDDAPPEGRKE
ncbi:hypothetical protein Tco_0474354 [Tanacetum coccineum]